MAKEVCEKPRPDGTIQGSPEDPKEIARQGRVEKRLSSMTGNQRGMYNDYDCLLVDVLVGVGRCTGRPSAVISSKENIAHRRHHMDESVAQEVPELSSVLDLIYQQANFCYRRLPYPKPHDVEDLEQEGKLLYVRLASKYDPNRGAKFTTLLHISLVNMYTGILQKAWRPHNHFGQVMDVDNLDEFSEPVARSEPETRLSEIFLLRLSRDAYLFAREFLHPGDEFIAWQLVEYGNLSPSPMRTKKRLRRFFGLTDKQTRTILAELAYKLSRASVEPGVVEEEKTKEEKNQEEAT